MKAFFLAVVVLVGCCVESCTPLVHDQLESDTAIVEQLADSLGREAAECYVSERVSDGNMTAEEGSILLSRLKKRAE